MRVFESIPAANLRPGDEVAYATGTQYVESVLIRPGGEVAIVWASNEPTATVPPGERVHRVTKADSESRKVRS
jgi:hypothetical protein